MERNTDTLRGQEFISKTFRSHVGRELERTCYSCKKHYDEKGYFLEDCQDAFTKDLFRIPQNEIMPVKINDNKLKNVAMYCKEFREI